MLFLTHGDNSGGTGFIGKNLVKQLNSSGYEVIVVTRNPKKSTEIGWKNIETSGIPDGVKAVLNLAGYPIATPFAYLLNSFKKNIFDSRVGTNRILAKAIREMENPPELFLSMSGVGYYPPSQTAVYDENGPNGTDYLAKLTNEWEKATILPTSVPTRVAIIRSGVVLGKGGGIMEVQMGSPVFTIFGNGQQYFPWIHVNDMARLIQYIIENNQCKGIFNGVAPDSISSNQFTHAMKRHAANKLIIPFIPWTTKRMFGEDVSVMLLEGQNVIPQRAQKMGFEFQFKDINSAMHDIYSSKQK